MLFTLLTFATVSLPVRGAWIEIECVSLLQLKRESLPVRGAWIEMLRQRNGDGSDRRSPCGERGLKWRT